MDDKNKRFDQLVKQEQRQIRYIASKYEKDPNDIDDLLQDSLLKAYLKFDTYDPEFKFYSWMKVIIRNIYIDKQRLLKNRQFHLNNNSLDVNVEGVNSLLSTLVSEDKNIIEEIESRETTEFINKLCSTLSEKLRGPFEMYLDNHSYKDIAKKFGIPITMLKTRIFLAKTEIKKIYKKK